MIKSIIGGLLVFSGIFWIYYLQGLPLMAAIVVTLWGNNINMYLRARRLCGKGD